MSGLEKMQANEAWRKNLLEHIKTERQPSQLKTKQIKNRNSLDIVDDFKKLHQNLTQEKRQNLDMSEEKIKRVDHSNAMTKMRFFSVERDESFETLELMCDKTASDPNSTLFKYINSEDKEGILADKKTKENTLTAQQDLKDVDVGSASLFRTLNVNGRQLVGELVPKSVDCTQLEDVEPPSLLWENTFACGERINTRTSPVKLVGLMRPSTILEGFEEDSSAVLNASDSQNSFKSALRSELQSDVTSSYETASEQSTTGYSAHDEESQNVDNLLYAAISKAKLSAPKYETNELLCGLDQSSTLIDHNVSSQQQTVCANNTENHNLSTCSSKSLIEILSDDSDDNRDDASAEFTTEKLYESKQTETVKKFNFCEIVKEEKENFDSGSDGSMVFNDTMEEVEYMMRKGLKYMESTEVSIPRKPALVEEFKVNTLQEMNAQKPVEFQTPKQNLPLRCSNNSLFGAKNKELTPKKTSAGLQILNSPKSQVHAFDLKSKKIPLKDFSLEMKRTNRDNFFKEPSNLPISRLKELNQQRFAHIISPIRAYRQNTATAPLMTIAKNVRTDVLDSSAFSEKGCNSPKIGNDQLGANKKPINSQRALPKKAYISSELKHVVDERTAITIPGGQKIHKFLEAAMVPTVLRHEGKVKVPGGVAAFGNKRGPETNTDSSARRCEQSLGDLSVISGDISMYTMKDAQRF